MTKIKVTKRELDNGSNHLIKVGYVELQTLLRFENPDYYTAGRDGWGADIYKVKPGVYIVTGYSPFGNHKLSYARNNNYEERARKIINDRNNTTSDTRRKLKRLLNQYVKEALEN